MVTGNLFRWLLDGDSGVFPYIVSSLGLGEHAWLTEPRRRAVGGRVHERVGRHPVQHDPAAARAAGDPARALRGGDGRRRRTPWQRFRYITLPLLRPVALSVLLLGVIYTFKVFDLIFVLTGGGPVDATTVLPIYIYDVSLKFFRFGEGAAASTLLLLGMLVVASVYLWLARREESA